MLALRGRPDAEPYSPRLPLVIPLQTSNAQRNEPVSVAAEGARSPFRQRSGERKDVRTFDDQVAEQSRPV